MSATWATTAALLGAILLGSTVGTASPAIGAALGSIVDPAILVLVGCLFFTIRFEGLAAVRRAPRTVLLAVALNFAAIPVIAFCLTAVIPDDALRLGVLIYCLAPCTDWFLGFTRLAGGDTRVGAALIPVQMILQLALYPVWLAVFAGTTVTSTLDGAGASLLTWFVAPAAVGLGLRLLLHTAPGTARERLLSAGDGAVPAVIAVVIVGIFAGNIGTILADPGSFGWVLAVVFVFFVATFALGEVVSRTFRLTHPEHVVLTMTTSARNAPMMLALTTAALPDQPVVAAAIILGMLIEFPHLTVLTGLLRRRAPQPGSPTAVATTAVPT